MVASGGHPRRTPCLATPARALRVTSSHTDTPSPACIAHPIGICPVQGAEGLGALLPHGGPERDPVGGALPEDVPPDQGRHRRVPARVCGPCADHMICMHAWPLEGRLGTGGVCCGAGSLDLKPGARSRPKPLLELVQTVWASSWCSSPPLTRPTAPTHLPSVALAWRRASGGCGTWPGCDAGSGWGCRVNAVGSRRAGSTEPTWLQWDEVFCGGLLPGVAWSSACRAGEPLLAGGCGSVLSPSQIFPPLLVDKPPGC